jgi:hypothetical protein
MTLLYLTQGLPSRRVQFCSSLYWRICNGMVELWIWKELKWPMKTILLYILTISVATDWSRSKPHDISNLNPQNKKREGWPHTQVQSSVSEVSSHDLSVTSHIAWPPDAGTSPAFELSWVYLTADGQSISSSLYRLPFGANDQILSLSFL